MSSDWLFVVLELLFAIPGWLGTIFVALCVLMAYQAVLKGLDNGGTNNR